MYARRGEVQAAKARMRMAFRLLSRRFPFARLKSRSSYQTSDVVPALCAARSRFMRNALERAKAAGCSTLVFTWICQRRAHATVMRILG